MLNIIHTLERLGFSNCYSEAVMQVRERLEQKGIHTAGMLVFEILGIHTTFTSEDEALMVAQAVVEDAIKNGGLVGEDPEEALAHAKARAARILNNPANKWMFVKPEVTATSGTTETREMIAGVETQVAVTSEGKFKKGEKERLALEMYADFQKNDPRAADAKLANQAFIGILIDKLGMTKAGATTYNYNMKKKLGGHIEAKPKRAK